MLAAASLGDSDLANRVAEKIQDIVFPYMARERENRTAASAKMLKKFRGIEIKVRRADWKLSDLKSMNTSIFGDGHGRGRAQT